MSGYSPEPGSPEPGPQPYGSMPPPPVGGYEPVPQQLQPPLEVQRAVTALYANIAWSVVGLVIAVLARDSTEDAIREQDPTLTPSEVSAAATLGTVFTAIITIAFGILFYLCAKKMLQGRSWARTVPTILVGLGVLFSVLALSTGTADTLSLITQAISLVIGIAFLYFAWSRPSSEFFRSARAPRR
jgi:hypothetical protein